MKNKRTFLWIVVIISFIAGAKDLLVQTLGDHTGYITWSFAVLIAAVVHVVFEKLYNSGTWLKGWGAKTSMLNILGVVLILVGVVMDWSTAQDVTLSSSFMVVVTKIVLFANTAIALINTDWTGMVKQLESKNPTV
jgi:hypothetical protein